MILPQGEDAIAQQTRSNIDTSLLSSASASQYDQVLLVHGNKGEL